MARVTVDGEQVSARTLLILDEAAKAAGVPRPKVLQGSWSAGDLSAGTHSGGGAVDWSVRGLTPAQQVALNTELRKRNGCSWLRTRAYGWTSGDHGHVIIRDEPGLSAAARQQVAAYDAGRNGLANRKPDPHPRPTQRPIEEMVMQAAPYRSIKISKSQTIPLNEWVTLDLGTVDAIPVPVGSNDWWVQVHLDLGKLTGAARNDLRYIKGRWARHLAAGTADTHGTDTAAISPDLPKSSWQTSFSTDMKGLAGVPVSFQVYVGSMKAGTVVSPMRLYTVEDENT